MIDPIVAEVRKYRMEHTQQFQSNLKLISEDLRKHEVGLGDRLVTPQPRRIPRKGEPAAETEKPR